MGLRQLIPGLMLRLDKDQECYDFIKWWTVISDASDYDFGNTDLPYLDIKNADVFEGPEIFFGRFADLSHLLCLCLLKIKLFFEIMRLEQTIASLGPSFPREILDLILSSVPQIPAVRTSHDIMYGDGSAREAMLDKLNVQIDKIFDAVEKANEYFWLAIINDMYDFSQPPESYSAGSVEETVLNMRYNYTAWVETPGAIEFIKVKVNRVVPFGMSLS